MGNNIGQVSLSTMLGNGTAAYFFFPQILEDLYISNKMLWRGDPNQNTREGYERGKREGEKGIQMWCGRISTLHSNASTMCG